MVDMIAGAVENSSGTWHRLKSLWPVAIAVFVAIAAMVAFWQLYNEPGASTNNDKITTGFSIVLAVILSTLPAALCTVQNISRRRQQGELESLKDTRAGETVLYVTATRAIGINAGETLIDDDYIVPIFVFFLITFVGFLVIFLGYGRPDFFATPTVLLGGLQASDKDHLSDYLLYQRQTFGVISMAFIGSYAYALGRILDRINNNDLYPISLYYYTARIIIACMVASVLRHSLMVILAASQATTTFSDPLLILLGFIVGFTPDLFILAMSRRAFQALKVWGSRPDPKDDTLPNALPLLMIDDLTREKIDRLNELGIDSAQILARQNPFLMLPRLPFELNLLVDWVAQAQLYVLVKEERLKALRELYVRNIVDLHVRLKNQASCKSICDALARDPAEAPALVEQLEADADFMRLKELEEALRPQCAA